MDQRIIENLTRQKHGFKLLEDLLLEEFGLLCGHDPQPISGIEFSIHELMQQLSKERKYLVMLLEGQRLKQYIAALAEMATSPEALEAAEELGRCVEDIDRYEQSCARQAEKNKILVLALMDQSQALLEYLYKKVVPKSKDSYSSFGRFAQRRPDAALIKGKF